jgi:DNA polymerase (family 10)
LRELPAGLLEILKIGGIGPKKAELLYKKLGIKDVEDLEKAVKAGIHFSAGQDVFIIGIGQ